MADSKKVTNRYSNENYILDVNLPHDPTFRISGCGRTFPDSGYHQVRLNAATSCIEYIISGKGIINTNGNSYIVNAGDTYMLHFGDDHNYYSDAKDPFDKIWINFHGTLSEAIIKTYGLEDVIVFRNTDTSKWIYKMKEIFENNLNDYDELHYRTSAYFVNFIRFLSLSHKEAEEKKDNLDKIRTYIDNNFLKDILIKDLPEISGLSREHTIRLFKQRFGITPRNYLLDNKMEFAKTLLLSTNESVSEIAYKLNYQNPTTFSAIFHKQTGYTPLQYRNKYKVF